ncbi:ABC transporter substrate-binding protein [Micromonospora sp. WMMD1082]|uniref:ABC transporter substrate-binding protein n=1 Tax=Micromonospora sp. WMMD1082 TaxID=3016104 RepID=UPI002418030D|nr:ABC transporter substrate-binding protein [Micromonospora sp. WMMD1082]MDG4798370.1 ABC transporter substrate-binding protein [Micromonospora sp. WMMD1082]
MRTTNRRSNGRARRAIASGVAVMLALSTVACVGDSDTSASTDEITLALPTEPDSLASEQAKTTAGYAVLRNIEESLLNRNPETNELVGELATSWSQPDPNRWRFELRQGVTFHDGSPFNAEAAAFSLARVWDRNNPTILTSYLGPDMTFTPVDEYTLDISSADPDPILPLRIFVSPISSMKAYQEDPSSDPLRPVGTGPYRFVEWVKGQRIVLEANPDWWGGDADDAGGEVTIQRATFVFRAEQAVRAGMVTSGEAGFGRWLTKEQCEDAPQCVSSPGVETIFARPDTMHPTLADRRVREAVALAINKDQILNQILGGGTPSGQMVGPSAIGFDESLSAYPYDLTRAQALIDEARADGVAVDAPLHIVARRAFIQRIDEIVQVIAGDLEKIGLTVDTQLQEQVAFEEMLRAPKPIDPQRGYVVIHSHGNELMDYSLTVNSYYRCNSVVGTYCDRALDRQHDEASQLTGDARDQALIAIAKNVHENVAAVPVGQTTFYFGLADNVRWKPRLDGFILLKEMAITS